MKPVILMMMAMLAAPNLAMADKYPKHDMPKCWKHMKNYGNLVAYSSEQLLHAVIQHLETTSNLSNHRSSVSKRQNKDGMLTELRWKMNRTSNRPFELKVEFEWVGDGRLAALVSHSFNEDDINPLQFVEIDVAKQKAEMKLDQEQTIKWQWDNTNCSVTGKLGSSTLRTAYHSSGTIEASTFRIK